MPACNTCRLHTVLLRQVDSEDTVFYSMRCYSDSTSNAVTMKLIQQRLGPLVRPQHLSYKWMWLSVVRDRTKSMPLAKLQPQLEKLMMLRRGATAAEVQGALQGMAHPPSWLLGQRASAPVSTVKLTFEVSIRALRRTAKLCAAQQIPHSLCSPDVTPPLGGMAFELKVECRPVGEGFCSIGLFVTPRDLPAGARRDFKY